MTVQDLAIKHGFDPKLETTNPRYWGTIKEILKFAPDCPEDLKPKLEKWPTPGELKARADRQRHIRTQFIMQGATLEDELDQLHDEDDERYELTK